MKPKPAIVLTTTAFLFATPALHAAPLSSLAVPSEAATASTTQNSIELRENGILIAKSPGIAPEASLLATDQEILGILWHPSKKAFRAGYIPDEQGLGLGSAAFNLSHAWASYSFAAGEEAHASGRSSIALGMWAYSGGDGAVALGAGSAGASYSLAANGGMANGMHSAAFNQGTAIGYMSSAFGRQTVAKGLFQTVVGVANFAQGSSSQFSNAVPAPTDALFIVGNGTLPSPINNYQLTRSNAFTVLKNGNAEVSGNLKVGGRDVVTTAAGSRAAFSGSLSSAGGFAIGSSASANSSLESQRSIQLATQNGINGGLHDDHSGALIWTKMDSGWGSGRLNVAIANQWGSYMSGTPALSLGQTETTFSAHGIVLGRHLEASVNEAWWGGRSLFLGWGSDKVVLGPHYAPGDGFGGPTPLGAASHVWSKGTLGVGENLLVNAKLGVGTTAPQAKLHVAGDIKADGVIRTTVVAGDIKMFGQ